MFFGIPDVDYQVQRATNLPFGAVSDPGRSNFPPGPAPTNGEIQVMDDFSDIGGPDTNGAAFYRLVVP